LTGGVGRFVRASSGYTPQSLKQLIGGESLSSIRLSDGLE
jgi:hypothetical protein